jgi:Predicted AAA-ATPase
VCVSSSNIILGTDDFNKIMRENAAIIDKTLFIKEWMETCAEVGVFLRPRRFGKSMLQSFFSIGAEAKKFGNYVIGKEIEFVEKHCGKYPVVLLKYDRC